MMTVKMGLKALNNSCSHTSCFYSRRLRPQTPQGSDDEGGKSTLAIPTLCVSLRAKRSPPVPHRHIHPQKVEQISRRSDHCFSLVLKPYFSLNIAWICVLERWLWPLKAWARSFWSTWWGNMLIWWRVEVVQPSARTTQLITKCTHMDTKCQTGAVEYRSSGNTAALTKWPEGSIVCTTNNVWTEGGIFSKVLLKINATFCSAKQ